MYFTKIKTKADLKKSKTSLNNGQFETLQDFVFSRHRHPTAKFKYPLGKLSKWNTKFICTNVTTCAVLRPVQWYDVCRTDLVMLFYILPLLLLSADHALNRHPMKMRKYMHIMYIKIQFLIRHPEERMHNILLAISLQSIKWYLTNSRANW